MKEKIKCLKKDSKDFPQKLKKLKYCPNEIFVLGDEKILSEFSLSVIGSRNCSLLGKEVARQISEKLGGLNVTIISGFARGIDTVAHKSCVQNNSKTIAVLGGGLGKIYPRENDCLIEDILKCGGAIVSEYPFEYPPLPKNFIERNRIIAALCDGIILVEAKKNSGSLHTIKYAKELGKKIFVVPGALNDERYEGSNAVLADGAFCIRGTEDILKEYTFLNCKINGNLIGQVYVNEEYQDVFNVLSYYPLSLTEIYSKLDKTPHSVLYQLTMLEMDGVIKRLEGQNFVKIK